MGRARTAAIYVLPAAAIVIAWMRIEGSPHPTGRAILLALVALAPALLPGPWLRVAAVALAVVFGFWLALGASFATPGRVVTRLWGGAREFYDVDLPFDPAGHTHMQGAVLLALFVFCLLLALAVAARRALLAVLILAVGAGWPGTLLSGRERAHDRRPDPRRSARHPRRHPAAGEDRVLSGGGRGRSRRRLRARPRLASGGRQGRAPALAVVGTCTRR